MNPLLKSICEKSALTLGNVATRLGRIGIPPLATVAINMRPVNGPWGGSSVFVQQLETCLKRRGFRVQYHLTAPVDVIVLIDPREDLESKAFGSKAIKAFKQKHPAVQIIHRINECDQRKNTGFMDGLLKEANQDADYTVYISEWLRDYFLARGFDAYRPHSVIYNGADPSIFHPIGNTPWQPGEPFRITTHHWANNPMKGFPVYEKLDQLIANGDLPGVEFRVIGRWPADLHWRAAKTFPPANNHDLAKLLRQCHAHITASLWEPCGMHHVEAAQCGLPMIYHENGGGIVEAGRNYGISFNHDLLAAVQRLQKEYPVLRKKVLASAPDGDVMSMAYATLIARLIRRGSAPH
jgi:glycosyltransferase involved in cell wall biosynthesis